MSIQMTHGAEDYGQTRNAHDPICLYDTTDGMAFGPTFDSREEAGAFMRWYERKYVGGLSLLAQTSRGRQKEAADEWRTFLADHAEAECPFDDESAGVGFLADRDGADGQAWTPQCSCECHDRGRDRVEVLGGWAE